MWCKPWCSVAGFPLRISLRLSSACASGLAQQPADQELMLAVVALDGLALALVRFEPRRSAVKLIGHAEGEHLLPAQALRLAQALPLAFHESHAIGRRRRRGLAEVLRLR